jgi:manganese/zinc/iron transport system substrate-binding protein
MYKLNKSTFFILLVLSIFDIFIVCPSFASKKFEVITTTTIISSSLLELVSSEHCKKGITITPLIRSGIDPHLYKPTRSDLSKIIKADLIFANGLNLEGNFLKTFERLRNSGKKIVIVGDYLSRSDLLYPTNTLAIPDPHIWMDLLLWRKAINESGKSLASYLNERGLIECSKSISISTKNYLKKIDNLHEYALKAFSTLPKNNKVLITAHDAFSYFAKRYGFKVKSIQGINTQSEASVSAIEKLVDFVVTNKIPSIFFESTVSTRNIQAIVEGVNANNFQLKIGGSLFSDGMGEEGTYEGTYIGMLDHNITLIASSLGGNVSLQGFNKLLNLKSN